MATATISKFKHETKYIKPINHSVKYINTIKPAAKVSYSLPFRIKFNSINIEGYSSSNPPPIPLQVIGYSNWIL